MLLFSVKTLWLTIIDCSRMLGLIPALALFHICVNFVICHTNQATQILHKTLPLIYGPFFLPRKIPSKALSMANVIYCLNVNRSLKWVIILPYKRVSINNMSLLRSKLSRPMKKTVIPTNLKEQRYPLMTRQDILIWKSHQWTII